MNRIEEEEKNNTFEMKPLNDVLYNKILLGNCIPHPHRPIIYFSGLEVRNAFQLKRKLYAQVRVYYTHQS